MPWEIVQRGEQWCVVKEGESNPIPGGCHGSESDAQKHMAALYAAEPGARAAGLRIMRSAASSSCSCHGTCASCGVAAGIAAATPRVVAAAQHVVDAATARVSAATEPFESPFPSPQYPTAPMFTRPDWLERGQGLTIQDDGTWAGYFHETGCIVGAPGYPDECAPATPSPTGYAHFHQQDVALEDGRLLRVGAIGNVGGHASPYVSPAVASRHYADPRVQMLLGRAYDDFDADGTWHGAYCAGVTVPGLTYGDIAFLRRCALSGDWRPMDIGWFERNGVTRQAAAAVDFFDCIGPTLVTRPGLALVRAYRRAGAARAAAILGGLGGIQLAEPVPEQGAPTMQPITLPDGTLLHVPDGTTVDIGADGVTVTVPEPVAAAAAPADPAPADPPVEPAPPVADPELARVAAMLDERVIPFIDSCEAVQAAEIEARRAALSASPGALTAAVDHEFVDENGDGKCDVPGCGLTEEMHETAAAPAPAPANA